MAHDGNTQRDRAPRPSEPGKGDRPSERAATSAPGRKPLFASSGGPKAGEAAAAAIPLKPLPKFNTVPPAAAAGPAAAKKAVAGVRPDIPVPNASAMIKRALDGLAEAPAPDIPLPDASADRAAAPPRPAREIREAAAPPAAVAGGKSEAQT